jgi:hypothetical protein
VSATLAGMDTTSELKTPSSDELPELLAEQRASGLTMAAFARERGLTTWKLYSAARRKGGLKPKRKAEKGAASAFAPVAVLGSPSADIELDLGPRGVLRIPAGFDPAALRRLLEVLRSR